MAFVQSSGTATAATAAAHGLPLLSLSSSPVVVNHWFKLILVLARESKDPRNTIYGLLGLIMTDAEYATLPQAAASPFVSLEGPLPQVNPADPAGVRETSKQNLASQAIQFANIAKLELAIMASVHPDVLSALANGPFGFLNVAMAAKITHIRTTIGLPTMAQLAQLQANMHHPAPAAATIPAIIQDLENTFEIFRMAQQPVNNSTQVLALKASVAFALSSFEQQFPTILVQQYPVLCASLRAADAALPTEMGFMARDRPRAYAAMEATPAAAKHAAIAAKAAIPATGSRPAPKPASSKLYCWKHGPGGHASVDCHLRDSTPGFDITATLANPKGGRTEKWISRRPSDAPV